MQITIEKEVLDAIQINTWDKPSPEEFETAYAEVLNNPVLAEILWEMEESLELKKKKLAYAKIVLSSEIYNEISEEFIMDEGMTFDEICTIGIGDPETKDLMDGWLSIDLVEVMTWRYLAHSWMTVDKITLLEFWAKPELITQVWPKQIAEMSQDELNSILTFVKK